MPSNPTDPPTEDNADKAEKLGLQESFSALLVQGHVLNRDEHAAHVVELLKDTDAVKGFIIAGGNRDAVALIQENDSFLVQTCGWNLLASNLKNNIFPNHLAERALVDLGVCRLMTSSLLTCTNLDYFADLMSIFRCIFGKSDVLMDKFVSTDGAVVALCNIVNQLDETSYTDIPLNYLATWLEMVKRMSKMMSDEDKQNVIKENGLTVFGMLKWHFKNVPELGTLVDEVLMGLF